MTKNERKGEYFHISDVLSVVTGKMVSTNGMTGIYNILNHMTGENLFTEQLPRAGKACRKEIIETYPKFAHVATKNIEITEKNWKAWLEDQTALHGREWFFIEPLPAGRYTPENPLAEAQAMRERGGNHANNPGIKR